MAIDIPVFEPPPSDKKDPMFSAALEYFDEQGQLVNCNVVYTHAPDWATANASFRRIYSNQLCSGQVKIVGVARAVGWFVQDEHGEQLAG
jgi:hypothetical protein